MHPFLERLVDVELLRRGKGAHPNDLDFARLANPFGSRPDSRLGGREAGPRAQWVAMMAHALRHSYARGAHDAHLEDRLVSAALDTTRYYRFTNHVDTDYLEEALAREKRGEIGARWLSIVHPPTVPADLDVLNLAHREWPHPCSSYEVHTESFPELYERAVADGVAMVRQLRAVWDASPRTAMPEIERAVANWNLSDGRPTERPCTKRHSTPLPLREFQDELREWIRSGQLRGSA